jgi:3',5'-cyclic AMP phosphodiesterase CpdA
MCPCMGPVVMARGIHKRGGVCEGGEEFQAPQAARLSRNEAGGNKMFKLGHISDLHVLAIDKRELTPRALLSKRLIGGANLLLKRKKSHSAAVIVRALEQLQLEGVDHVAVTGDVSNIALPSEFKAVAELLAGYPEATTRISAIPGNHDYYTHDAARGRYFERALAPYMESDLPQYRTKSGYPFCHLRGDIAIIGLNSGIVSGPMLAIGKVDHEQLRVAVELLDDPEVARRYKVVMIHHPVLPPQHIKQDYTRRLVNADEVLSALRSRDVDLVIHGHNHYFHHFQVPHTRGQGTMHICEAGSTSVVHGKAPEFGGKFNIYHIDQGRLLRIETHLFEGEEQGFVRWREHVEVQPVVA